MHPTPTFAWTDRAELLAFVAERAFASVVAQIGGELAVAQVPVLVDGDTLLLHLSRGNPLAAALPLRVTIIATGPDAYVSPDWYSEPDGVPTWNYVSVELTGELVATDAAGLVDILARQSAQFEARLPGKPPWTLDMMAPAVRDAKLRGIVGATLRIAGARGTRKLSQNKLPAERARVIAELEASARPADREIAQLLRQ